MKNRWMKVMETVDKKNVSLGDYFSSQLLNNPKHLLFSLARYKHSAHFLAPGKTKKILELGCNEGVGSLVLAERGRSLLGVDFDRRAIEWANANLANRFLKFTNDNFLGKKFGSFDAVVSLDVIEHIPRRNERFFLSTISSNLHPDGVCIVGTPNQCAKKYASKASAIGHINLYNAERLRSLFNSYFHTVMVFSINDELFHTGYYPMAHYLLVVGCLPK